MWPIIRMYVFCCCCCLCHITHTDRSDWCARAAHTHANAHTPILLSETDTPACWRQVCALMKCVTAVTVRACVWSSLCNIVFINVKQHSSNLFSAFYSEHVEKSNFRGGGGGGHCRTEHCSPSSAGRLLQSHHPGSFQQVKPLSLSLSLQ